MQLQKFTNSPVGLEDAGNLWDQGVIGIGITEQRTDRQQNLTRVTFATL